MSTSGSSSSVIPIFNGENCHFWAIKMKFFFRCQGLWKVVFSKADLRPLRENPTIAKIKAYEKEKVKKDKVITCLHSGLAYQGLACHIFTKIMDLETPK